MQGNAICEIKAIIFDLYDTLIYTPKNYSTNPFATFFGSLEACKNNRLAFMTEELPTFEAMAVRFGLAGQVDYEKCYQQLNERIDATIAYPETIAVLEKLKHQGYILGVISNLSSLYKKPFYTLGLDKYFDQKVFSCEVGYVKPDPKIYQIMINRLGLPPHQLLMTGDQYSKDVAASQRTGMMAIHLNRQNSGDGAIGSLEGIYRFI